MNSREHHIPTLKQHFFKKCEKFKWSPANTDHSNQKMTATMTESYTSEENEICVFPDFITLSILKSSK